MAQVKQNERKKSLTDRARKVVDFVEQKFWENGGLPSYEFISAGVNESLDYVRGVLERNSTARAALVARGVDLTPNAAAAVLTTQQLMAANVVLNAHDVRSLREKLQVVGVSSQQWHAWLRQPGFSQYLTKRAEAAFEANDFAAYNALAENVADGDLNAVKFHFEMRGKYKNSLDINVNVESVVSNIVEIVAKHVQDQDTLLAIAAEIGELGVGGGNRSGAGQDFITYAEETGAGAEQMGAVEIASVRESYAPEHAENEEQPIHTPASLF